MNRLPRLILITIDDVDENHRNVISECLFLIRLRLSPRHREEEITKFLISEPHRSSTYANFCLSTRTEHQDSALFGEGATAKQHELKRATLSPELTNSFYKAPHNVAHRSTIKLYTPQQEELR